MNKPTRTQRKWQSMKSRCLRESHPAYGYYGGRGIKICERWMVFGNFLEDMGEAPDGLWLERIDNDGNYELSNCKWATPKEQAANRRKAVREVDPNCLAERAKAAGLPYHVVYQRVRLGWDVETALKTPKFKQGSLKRHDREKWGIRQGKTTGPIGYRWEEGRMVKG